MWYFSQDAKNHTAGLIQQAGFIWLAHQIEWPNIETAPGVYDWSELDEIVNTATSYNLKVMSRCCTRRRSIGVPRAA